MIVCLYLGPAHDCPECGGYRAEPGGASDVCSDECVERRAGRLTELEDRQAARRHEEEVYGRAVERLASWGFTYAEIDQLMEGIV